MKLLKQLLLITLLAGYTLVGLAAPLTPEQTQAKQQGKILWNQNKRSEAVEQLIVAAKAGDEESQYLLADSLSRTLTQFPKEYQNNAYWYEAAANQGNVYAMYRLNQLCQNYSQLKQCYNSTDHWSKAAMETLKPKIAANDPESLYQYYIFTRDIDYLKKSAEANFPEGQYRYAKYLETNQKNNLDFEWYKKAADNGHVKAMFEVGLYFVYTNKEPDMAKKYLLMAVNKGYINALDTYKNALDINDKKTMARYNTTPDPVKNYAYAMLLEKINDSRYAIRHEPDLTPEQVKEAKAFAEQWQKEHPPLSYYPSPVFNGSLDR